MLTELILDVDWVARRTVGRGFRRDAILPDGADPAATATFATCVIRLPLDLAERLETAATRIAGVQPGHYVCPAESIHVTVCGPLPRLGPQPGAAAEDLRALAPRLSGGRLRVVRLGIGDTSVFAALEVEGADLLAVRRELARRWGVASRQGLAGPMARRLLWANLIRFGAPPSRALIDAVAGRRHPAHRGFPIEAVELVWANRAMSPERTTVLGRVSVLGPDARP